MTTGQLAAGCMHRTVRSLHSWPGCDTCIIGTGRPPAGHRGDCAAPPSPGTIDSGKAALPRKSLKQRLCWAACMQETCRRLRPGRAQRGRSKYNACMAFGTSASRYHQGFVSLSQSLPAATPRLPHRGQSHSPSRSYISDGRRPRRSRFLTSFHAAAARPAAVDSAPQTVTETFHVAQRSQSAPPHPGKQLHASPRHRPLGRQSEGQPGAVGGAVGGDRPGGEGVRAPRCSAGKKN